jgi:hypothetical protein
VWRGECNIFDCLLAGLRSEHSDGLGSFHRYSMKSTLHSILTSHIQVSSRS